MSTATTETGRAWLEKHGYIDGEKPAETQHMSTARDPLAGLPDFVPGREGTHNGRRVVIVNPKDLQRRQQDPTGAAWLERHGDLQTMSAADKTPEQQDAEQAQKLKDEQREILREGGITLPEIEAYERQRDALTAKLPKNYYVPLCLPIAMIKELVAAVLAKHGDARERFYIDWYKSVMAGLKKK